MATIVSQHIRLFGRHKEFFKKDIFSKNVANFLVISIEHVFTVSNRNWIKNRVYNKKLKQILSKTYSFPIQTLVCIFKFA